MTEQDTPDNPASSTRAPVRTVRVEDDLWTAAKGAAAGQKEAVSRVVRRALVEYVVKYHPDRDVRRRARRW